MPDRLKGTEGVPAELDVGLSAQVCHPVPFFETGLPGA